MSELPTTEGANPESGSPGERANLDRGAASQARPGSFVLRLSSPSELQKIKSIQYRVCAEHGITIEDMLSVRRNDEFVAARHEAIRRAYSKTKASTPCIGRAFNRSHTTILFVLDRLNKKRPRRIEKPGVLIKLPAERRGWNPEK